MIHYAVVEEGKDADVWTTFQLTEPGSVNPHNLQQSAFRHCNKMPGVTTFIQKKRLFLCRVSKIPARGYQLALLLLDQQR